MYRLGVYAKLCQKDNVTIMLFELNAKITCLITDSQAAKFQNAQSDLRNHFQPLHNGRQK